MKLEKLFDKLCKVLHLNFKDKTKNLLLQMFKFLLVGGLAFVIDYVTLIICKEVFHINVLISAAIAFIVSVIINYILSVKWVFDVDKNKSKEKNFITFIICHIGIVVLASRASNKLLFLQNLHSLFQLPLFCLQQLFFEHL